ncbi:ankyrin repeat domain-containing protein 52 [Nannizzia gypsea CBS 118893]|uniref:Ankyrin repeat domain-containing protein 52 n=1 Tax=Arthroderma gypseum (strain ATCC MYA-4604 / CBS 118893) TaxID=535722 RepID=E4UMN4_ARTGP|nr:ankyrin repeat domain-containing protein 52 [Nannizzia gypsea CBS 118893]EFQ99451.1 ankyrin repeat domain-containing protein 52 [Nannizzia gypsea CBS 118893]
MNRKFIGLNIKFVLVEYQENSIKENGVPEARAGTLRNATRRPVLDRVLECPFGDNFQPSGKVESSAVFASDALQSHIAGHMKEIALLTLQKLPSDGDENAENIDSDQPLVDDDGPAGTFGARRVSMYSVLDDEDLDLDFQDGVAEAAAADGSVGHREEDDINAQVTELDLEDRDDSGMTKLHHAVLAGDPGLIDSLILGGVNVNARDEYCQTPLHYAVERGFNQCTEMLIRHGADVETIDNAGFSPLLWAVVAGQEGTASNLLSIVGDSNPFSADGKSALAWAASLGWTWIAKTLIGHGASISGSLDTQRTLPLEEAAASGDLNTVQLLLEFGGDPNHRNRDGWSAIHWAAEEGHLEIVRRLLQTRANADAVSFYGTSPLHCAANGGHAPIVNLLLNYGADPLKATCHGWTALHHAAFMGHSHVVRCLLDDDRVRLTASKQDNHGWSVLHLAVHSRNLATVRILLDKSVIAEPQTLLDMSGLTAEEWLNREVTTYSQRAIGNLAFTKSRCCRAATGLRQAVTIGNVPLIGLLIRLGHGINGTDSGRRTALYYAAKKGRPSIMDLLLDLGADPNILPVGRKSWEEFIMSVDILQRLKRAGYRKQDTDPDDDNQIRQAFLLQSQPPMPNQPGEFVSDESTPPMLVRSLLNGPARPPAPVLASPTSRSPDHSASSRRTRSPAPSSQTNSHKRKERSSRSSWWRRFLG